jgi:ribose 5-phosphate isomerase
LFSLKFGLKLLVGAMQSVGAFALLFDASRRMAVTVDPTKLAYPLGVRTPLPVVVVEYGWLSTKRCLDPLGCDSRLWIGPQNGPKLTAAT